MENLNIMPSLEEAKEICKKYKRPLQNNIIVISLVVPSITTSGIRLPNKMVTDNQKKQNENGMMVVISPFKREKDNNPIFSVYEGEFILFRKNTEPLFTKLIKSKTFIDGFVLKEKEELRKDMYKQYVVMCLSIHDLICVINN